MVSGLALSIQGVHHAFNRGSQSLPVLADLSLDVAPGDFVALLGPSGCGKSTLLRLIAGLDQPHAGRIAGDGQAITGPDPSRVMVFQDPPLFPWRSVRRNVQLGLEARGELAIGQDRVETALKLVGLDGFADALPHHLSGGMAQRAALARALVNDPRLLILDEPLGKLDALTRATLQAELVGLWQRAGFTVLLVTHDVDEALYLASRVVVFSDRPARILSDIRIDRPHPRPRGTAEVQELRRILLKDLGHVEQW